MPTDYRSTVFLPRTDFAMRANLPEREPALLERWERIGLYRRLREASRGREKFVLHDGPPYANGNLHIGHALNKILKDVINRSQQMLGKDANYVPGWDCHGLPIEWKIEEQYREEGRNKDDVDIVEFRKECRDFAAHWIGVQREEFKRLGVIGDWDGPYTTMSFAAEAQIAIELMKFAASKQLYRGSKPVMWSVVERTALAEAEVEYHDRTSDIIWVAFPIIGRWDGKKVVQVGDRLLETSIPIWTTTPWTIPGNRAIAFSSNPDMFYQQFEVEEVDEKSFCKVGQRLIVADKLAEDVKRAAKIVRWRNVGDDIVSGLDGLVCAHPLAGVNRAYDFKVPLLAGEHVTDDAGTGFVHTAPSHGREDFEVWTANAARLAARGINTRIPHTVDAEGRFTNEAPGFSGKRVLTDMGEKGDADEAVIQALVEAGTLIARGKLTHQYPHSWRSKKPVIFRNTPQWFISMGDDQGAEGLRAKALRAIDDTAFYPPQGRNRLRSMIESRPDWVVSRQRSWGVPIAVFVRKRDGEILLDETVNRRIVDAFKAEGADAWFDSPPSRFLGKDYDPADYEQVTDILDVWFDSGSTHSFVLETRPDLKWPASLYLEGSDQHRGWFQSSLLESCGTRGRAPYDAVLTHGFVLAEEGAKMSKSVGNTVAPQDVLKQYGGDILRLWVVASDYSEDLKIGPEILKYQVDSYRRLRNTFRYLLGNLDGFSEAERLPAADMPELERWVLHRLAELDRLVRRCCAEFDFHTLFSALHNFCAVDLSAFYFDIRKDVLYCNRNDDPLRRAARTVLDELFSCLTSWLAPVICFTAEEAWLSRHPSENDSVHLRVFPDLPEGWRDDALAARWETIRAVRRVVTGCLEIERAEKRIGASLQAHPVVYVGPGHAEALRGIDLAEIAITSDITVLEEPPPAGAFTLADVAGVAVVPGLAEGSKCARCWRVLPEVGGVAGHEDICRRCADAVDHLAAAAE